MIPINMQPPEKQVHDDGAFLDVVRVFQTIQGEGPFTGVPCVFVRLAGCNLKCPGCDTVYTGPTRQQVPIHDLLTMIGRFPRNDLVVLTGGEPFRQNLSSLMHSLLDARTQVQIETNGMLAPVDEFPWGTETGLLTVVCSPKTKLIHPKLERHIGHLKYVLNAEYVSPKDGLPTCTLGGSNPARPFPGFPGTVWVQPEDTGYEPSNHKNLQACVSSATKFGYRVSIQTHKIMEVR